MATLYDLVGDWKEVYDMANDPEMDVQCWFDTMDAIEGNIEDKAEGYAKVRKCLEADKKAIKDEKDKLAEKERVLGNKIDRLDARMKESMEAIGKDRLNAGVYTWSIQKNGGVLPLNIAEGTKAADLPERFITRPDPVINNKAIREALEAGETLDFAKLGERGTSLRLK